MSMARTKMKTKMNKWEREVQASLFSSEQDALKALEQEYKRTLQSIMDQVKLFDADIQMLDDAIVDAGGTDEALMSQRQSKAYQRQFQNNLKAQIEAILDKLHSDEYSTINDYLNGCYKDAFVGSEYALAMQGVPVITPVRPEAVTKAVLLDSKVVKGYYARIGIDINKLKPKIASEITRGIASAMSYADIARNLDAVSGSGLYNAKRIVRTEGHRIQQAAWMDSAEDAKAHGADLVRIWSSTLDGRTRETHRMYDGETAEVGGKFKLNGRDVDAPGYFGIPSEDCNCRCVALSRPRWALNDPVRKNDGFNGKIREFDTPDDYEDFKEKYWGKDNTTYMDYLSQLEQKYGTKDYQTLLGKLSNKEYTKLNRLEDASPMWKPKVEKPKFVPAKDIKEAKARFSEALGIDEESLSLGRMKLELANQYLDGIETFTADFPEIKGLYTAMNTKCGGRNLGINKLEAKGRHVGRDIVYDITYALALRNPSDLQSLYDDYERSIVSKFQYKGMSPKATAIHELVHGLDRAIAMKQNGFFEDGVLQTEIKSADWNKYTRTISARLIKGAKSELFGSEYGAIVYDGIEYLGSYALTDSQEMLAQAVSYEYVNDSNPFGAGVVEKLKELYNEAFK